MLSGRVLSSVHFITPFPLSPFILSFLSGTADVQVLVPATGSTSDQNLIYCVLATKDQKTLCEDLVLNGIQNTKSRADRLSKKRV